MPPSDLDPEKLPLLAIGLVEAAAASEEWSSAWARIARAFEATSASLILTGENGPESSELAYMPGWTASALGLFAAHFWKTDPFIAISQKPHEYRAYLGEELVPLDEFKRSELWNDFSRHYMNAFHFLVAGSLMPSGGHVGIGLHRPPDAEPFGTVERRALNQLLPYITAVSRLRHTLSTAQWMDAVRAASLDRISSGAIVADPRGAVIVANAAAEALCRHGWISFSAHRPISAGRSDETARLLSLIAEVARGGAGGTLTISRSNEVPLIITVSPLPMRLTLPFGMHWEPHYLALIIIRDPSLPIRVDIVELRTYYQLTRTEAGLVRDLTAGWTVEEIASDRKVSVYTIRAHIRSILVKTGARNMRELVSIATRFAINLTAS